ncbi:type I toxin-antitoxin system toxin IbsC [Shigella flexneri]|nr:type I toxin-antitoxin system toxin IbsC [Shigella flexneri]
MMRLVIILIVLLLISFEAY